MSKLFNYHRYENFLDFEINQQILNYCIENKTKFLEAKVGKIRNERKVNKDFRISYVNKDLGNYNLIFSKCLKEYLEDFFLKLKINPFNVESFELELAAHGDGAFFKPHIDTHTTSEKQRSNRVISAVYYFYSEPKKFKGGELLLHPFEFFPGNDSIVELEPLNNSLVIFPSFGLHEVSPVVCPDLPFENWRFAINCWINKY